MPVIAGYLKKSMSEAKVGNPKKKPRNVLFHGGVSDFNSNISTL